ncbi:MAG: hypothetical protein LWW95_11270 [Candidatus Desulfofervidus auxilii]|nr:hypothetical protein [Candidatus Desulfofervidus auxilii]
MLKEDWNEYKLEDGIKVKVKLVVQLISYIIDPRTNKIMRNPLKEPVINIRHNIVITAEFLEEKLQESE